jgi:5-methylcytosine-specific restriction protein A
MGKNPPWTRDELILALNLYINAGRVQLGNSDPQVIELSELLNNLPIHPTKLRQAKFRNPNGVSMKLGNFSSIDPNYDGVGLERGSKLELEVWNDFADEPYLLSKVASAIRRDFVSIISESLPKYDVVGDEEFKEGRILTQLHKQRERDPKLAKRKKDKVLKDTGRLACEVCSFDFAEVYGELGFGFAECHHLIPLSELDMEKTVRLSDLAIVCANCHRMLHRRDEVLSILELKKHLKRKFF